MTDTNKKIARPTDMKNSDGFAKAIKWDSGNKSALVFFSSSRTIGKGEKARKEYTDFSVRLWGRDAHFLDLLLAHKAREEASDRKYPLLINMDLRMKSWKRPTGQMVGANSDVPETTDVVYFDGKNTKMMDIKTYDIIASATEYPTPEEQAAQQQAPNAA